MFTSYDEIWEQFLTINKTDEINLPNIDEKIYSAINSAVKHYNNRMDDSITCNDAEEVVSEKLTDNKLLLIIHFLKLTFLENQLIQFSTLWTPFTKDVGVKNINFQLSALKELVSLEKNVIEDIILFSDKDYI